MGREIDRTLFPCWLRRREGEDVYSCDWDENLKYDTGTDPQTLKATPASEHFTPANPAERSYGPARLHTLGLVQV